MLSASWCFADKEAELERSKVVMWDVAREGQSWGKIPKFVIPQVLLQTWGQEGANMICDVCGM